MKKNIHPKYNILSVSCSCGNVIHTRSTLITNNLNIDICNMCHPFYTGAQRIIDTRGRVNQFNKRFNISAEKNFISTKNNKKQTIQNNNHT